MDGWLIALLIVVIWFILLAIMYKKKYLKGNLSLFGPALMIKTKRGKRFIERVGENKFWKYYGDFGIVLSFFLMFFIFSLLLWQAYMVTTIPPSRAPSPVEALGIPGINPIIPIGYGILALVIAVVLHEFSHGFLVSLQKLKIESLGVLLFIVPIGAFVEPDEDELMKTEKHKRMRVFAAGPTTNIVLAVIFLVIFASLMNGVNPKYGGLYISSNYKSSPNYKFFNVGDGIIEINGIKIENYNDFYNVSSPVPGEKINLTLYSSSIKNVSVYSGVVVIDISKGYPAYESGIKSGWIFYSINGTIIKNQKDFVDTLNLTKSGEKVDIKMIEITNSSARIIEKNVTLADKYEYYSKYAPQLNRDYFKGKGFLGVTAMFLGINVGDITQLKNLLSNPYRNAKNAGDYFSSTMFLIALPFAGLMPFPPQLENLYTMPFPGFWLFENSMYWIFWINLMLGLTNLLPAVPLDGGYLFKDAMTYIADRFKMKNPEKFASGITSFFSLFVFFLIIWQFFGPYM